MCIYSNNWNTLLHTVLKRQCLITLIGDCVKLSEAVNHCEAIVLTVGSLFEAFDTIKMATSAGQSFWYCICMNGLNLRPWSKQSVWIQEVLLLSLLLFCSIKLVLLKQTWSRDFWRGEVRHWNILQRYFCFERLIQCWVVFFDCNISTSNAHSLSSFLYWNKYA